MHTHMQRTWVLIDYDYDYDLLYYYHYHRYVQQHRLEGREGRRLPRTDLHLARETESQDRPAWLPIRDIGYASGVFAGTNSALHENQVPPLAGRWCQWWLVWGCPTSAFFFFFFFFVLFFFLVGISSIRSRRDCYPVNRMTTDDWVNACTYNHIMPSSVCPVIGWVSCKVWPPNVSCEQGSIDVTISFPSFVRCTYTYILWPCMCVLLLAEFSYFIRSCWPIMHMSKTYTGNYIFRFECICVSVSHCFSSMPRNALFLIFMSSQFQYSVINVKYKDRCLLGQNSIALTKLNDWYLPFFTNETSYRSR